MSTLTPVNMLWIGSELGQIEHLSAVSFLAAGHPVHLHVYENVRNVPEGVSLKDAGETMSFGMALSLRHRKTSSFALSSDYFRFALQKRGLGLWADLDMVCLAPVHPQEPVLFGWESNSYVNGALLYVAQRHPLLDDALAAFERSHIPPWVPMHKAIPLRFGRLLDRDFGPGELPRGVYGPKALTALAQRHGLTAQAQPQDVFYPLHPRRAREVFKPGTVIEQFVSPRSLTIHLWNEKLGDLKRTAPPSTSALAALMRSFGV